MRRIIIASIIIAMIAALSLVACSGGSAGRTDTPEPSTATPAPLFTLEEAQLRVQEDAAHDRAVPAITNGTQIACFTDASDTNPPQDRYSPERQT